jgi:Mrp family chromosome partitioning ATPase/capsular polysaccharide biosynthesis protein
VWFALAPRPAREVREAVPVSERRLADMALFTYTWSGKSEVSGDDPSLRQHNRRGQLRGHAAHDETRHASTLRDYFSLVHRRKWIILAAVILVPTVAVFYSARQTKLYQAEAQVLLAQTNLANALTGTPESSVFQPVERISQTQADLARVPIVARRAVNAAGVNRSAGQLLGESSVTADLNSNFLFFTVTDTVPSAARKLATEYARQFTIYRAQLDTAALKGAREDLETRMAEIRANGGVNSSLYASLASKDELLRTMEALQTSNASLVQEANSSWQVAPKPRRNGILGLALGILLGLGLAALREALDTRVRSADEIGERLGLPLLARIPEPPRRLRRGNNLSMLIEPSGVEAEAFRMLRTNLDFVRLDKKSQVIMVSSAVEAEGKSTTAANLAVALARSGKRVALVDLDLRRPFLHQFFRSRENAGLTHVALGYASLEEALIKVPVLESPSQTSNENGNGNGSNPVSGLLEVLTAGPVPPNLDDFLGGKAVADILGALAKRADVVLVDAPPLLLVGDAMALATVVDAAMIITRINVVRRPMLKELKRVLDGLPTEKLGFVLTGAEREESYAGYGGYAYRYTSYSARMREKVQ